MLNYSVEIMFSSVYVRCRRSGLVGLYTLAGEYVHGDLRIPARTVRALTR